MPKIKKIQSKPIDEDQRSQLDTMFDHQMGSKEEVKPEEKNEEQEEHEEQQLSTVPDNTDEKPIVEEDDQGAEEQIEHEEHPEEPKETQQEPPKDDVVDRLRQRIAELETGTAFGPEEQGQEQKQTPKETQTKPAEVEVENIEEFITEKEYDEIQSDPKKLNDILLRVYKRAVADTSERVFKQIPDIVQASSARQMTLTEAVRGFYTENPDLRKHASYVGYVANQVKSKDPSLNIKDVLSKTEQQVREHLAISKQAEEQEETRQNTSNGAGKPAFVQRGSGGHRGGKQDTRTDFQKQADDMLKSLERR